MKRTKMPPATLSEQMRRRTTAPVKRRAELDGNAETMISTGSTLLDLAITGGRVRGGGIPAGVFVEVFGVPGSGKTVLLCEVAGAIQRQGGQVMFRDPEARLNKQFAQMFGLKTDEMDYARPERVPEIFTAVRSWQPKPAGKTHGVFADSLAALSTQLEMENEEGDKMGARRAKEFSEELRKTCRILANNNYLMMCSNQVRENIGVTFGEKYTSPGGKALGFYSSLRIQTAITKRIREKKTFKGKEITRVVGVEIEAEVVKSSVWAPYHTAPITILFDYGVDDIRENLRFLKQHTGATTYCLGRRSLHKSLNEAIQIIEEAGAEEQLRNEVISLWEQIESKFKSNRKTKIR